MVEGIPYKVLAYADDLLFSLINPVLSFPNLFCELELYGSLSYFKINLSKSEALGVAAPNTLLRMLKLSFKFKWTDQALKYLGTFIPADLSCIFGLNFPPLLHKVCTLLDMWHRGASFLVRAV